MNENQKWFNRLGIGYVVFTVLAMVVQFIAMGVAGALPENIAENYSILIMMLPMYIIAVPISMAVISTQKCEKVEKQPFGFKKFIACFFVAFGAMYVGNIVGSVLNIILSAIAGTEAQNPLANILGGNTMWQNFIVVVICAPICEELLFRKLLVDRIIKYGEVTAIVVSALAFGLFHGNIVQFIYATLIGMVLAYMYIKSGNIILTIIVHMILNFNGSILSLYILDKSNYMETIAKMQEITDPVELQQVMMDGMGGIMMFGLYGMVILALTVVGLIIFFTNVKKLEFAPGEITLQKGERFKNIVLNPGVIIFIVIWIVMAVLAILK